MLLDLYEWRLSKGFSRRYDDCTTQEKSSKQFSDHRTVSLISHTVNIVARVLESKIEKVVEED